MRPRLGSLAALAAALAVAAVALTACGSEPPREEAAQPVGQKLVGSVAQMAECDDWNAGSRGQRLATIHDIRQQINLKDSAVQTPELSDDAAYEILTNHCGKDYAGSFRLYKLYARAASFAPLAEN
jgi:hypothetical protein